ncbi:uncharacterized protein LOC142557314 isoform X1 [Dermacentor variabilis]|uniref:uncharacterized protein LOC142557314 isoform X1 n=1 Tax=Dermacentor variabilis TaxID=34621 RepID=UPI003F5BA821
MPDHGRRALHRVCDSVSGVNWRPTRFVDELMLTRYACCVCHVIPSTTVVLPCCHAICEQCQRGSVVQDGGSVCPLDREPFCEDECQKQQLPERKKQNLKAYCWNEAQGCNFVGPLADLLRHFEAECAFHSFPCQECGENVPNAQLAAHYIGGCSNCSSPGSATVVTDDVAAARRDVVEPWKNTYEDDISTLQSQVNELTQAARIQGAPPLEELNAALAASLQSLKASVALATEKFSETIGDVSQAHQRMLSRNAEESSLARESEAIRRARRSDAEAAWREETRDILRNLEICARESVSCLQCMYRSVRKNVHDIFPTVQVFPVPPRIDDSTARMGDSCPPSCAEVKEAVYLVFLSNTEEILKISWPFHAEASFHRRGAWCRVLFGLWYNFHYSLQFHWSSEQRTIGNVPRVVRVSILHNGSYIDLPLVEELNPLRQIAYTEKKWETYERENQLRLEIVVRD